MTAQMQRPESPVKDRNYNLINVPLASLTNAWQMETSAADLQR